eukprot:scaffold105629_cov70-Phaeocystis_antarctica.AAC.2
MVICRFARPRHLFRRREQRWHRPAFGTASGGGGARLCSQAPAATPCRRPQPSSRSPRARASRSSSRRASPRPAIRRVLGRAGPPRRRPPPRLSNETFIYTTFCTVSLTSRASAPVNSAPPAPQPLLPAAPASCSTKQCSVHSGCRRSSGTARPAVSRAPSARPKI